MYAVVFFRWDESDVDSGVAVLLRQITPVMVVTSEVTQALHPPAEKSFCGVIYAIVKIDIPANANENPKYNNFVVDTVILKCDTAGECIDVFLEINFLSCFVRTDSG